MTDPVDTDALRDLLVTGAPPLSAPAAGHDKWIGQVRIAGVTAADEIDRLRRELRWMSDHATQRAAAYERAMSIMAVLRDFKRSMDQLQAMDREIRACSDRSFAEVTGRPGTDAELRRFYRSFKKALSDDVAQRQRVELASIREQNELIREQYWQFKREADTP